MSAPTVLSRPLYGASFVEAQRRFWRKYLVSSGRASRSEFWWWMLGFLSISLLLSLVNRELVRPLDPTPSAEDIVAYSMKTGVLSTLWSLANFVGGVTLTVRRLHDTNRSGWWWFVQLVVGIGSVVLLVLVALPTDPAGEHFDATTEPD